MKDIRFAIMLGIIISATNRLTLDITGSVPLSIFLACVLTLVILIIITSIRNMRISLSALGTQIISILPIAIIDIQFMGDMMIGIGHAVTS